MNVDRQSSFLKSEEKMRPAFDRYVSDSPLLSAIPELFIFTLIAAGWMLLFDQAIEDQFPNLFPISSTAFSFFLFIVSTILYANFYTSYAAHAVSAARMDEILALASLLDKRKVISYEAFERGMTQRPEDVSNVLDGNQVVLGKQSNENLDRLSTLLVQYSLHSYRTSDYVCLRGLAIFCVYLMAFTLPWLLWGDYRWNGVWIFALIEWPIFAFLRFSIAAYKPLLHQSKAYNYQEALTKTRPPPANFQFDLYQRERR